MARSENSWEIRRPVESSVSLKGRRPQYKLVLVLVTVCWYAKKIKFLCSILFTYRSQHILFVSFPVHSNTDLPVWRSKEERCRHWMEVRAVKQREPGLFDILSALTLSCHGSTWQAPQYEFSSSVGLGITPQASRMLSESLALRISPAQISNV